MFERGDVRAILSLHTVSEHAEESVPIAIAS
jgi:hypothetical protein